jgi:hypothetical protein
MQGYTYKKSYKKIILKKTNLIYIKLRKKSQMNRTHLSKN